MLSIYGVVDFMDFKTDVQVDSDFDTLLTHVTLTQGKNINHFQHKGHKIFGDCGGTTLSAGRPEIGYCWKRVFERS